LASFLRHEVSSVIQILKTFFYEIVQTEFHQFEDVLSKAKKANSTVDLDAIISAHHEALGKMLSGEQFL
jgi:hypothetical protein